jgi:hypothetical protein
METASAAGRPARHGDTRLDGAVTTAQAHGAPRSLNWADDMPDVVMEQPVVERMSTGASGLHKDWPPLMEMDVDPHSSTEL